jgi:hypothetical protein
MPSPEKPGTSVPGVVTGWQRFDDVPCPYAIYLAWNADEPDVVPWLVVRRFEMNVGRVATHWHTVVWPELPGGRT